MAIVYVDDTGCTYKAGGEKVGTVDLRGGGAATAAQLAGLAGRCTAWIVGGPLSGPEAARLAWAEHGWPEGGATGPALDYRPGTADRGGTVLKIGETTMRSAEPWGWTDAHTAAVAAAVWEEAVSDLRGAALTSGPTAMGITMARILGVFARCQPLPVEAERTIRSTTTQGRVEFFGEAYTGQVTEIDARAAYLSMMARAPAGPTRRVEPGSVVPDLMYETGWYHVAAHPPEGWPTFSPGILPAKIEGRTSWPTAGRVESWCTGHELALAERYGWHPQILGGWYWPEARRSGSLDRLHRRLVAIHGLTDYAVQTPGQAAASRMARTVAVHLIGSLFSAARHTNRVGTLDELQASESAVNARQLTGTRWRWTERRNGWADTVAGRAAHWRPEIAANVWGYGRARLLDAPTARLGERAGALHVGEDARLIGVHTDALYVAGDVPEWLDDGRPGRYRAKHWHFGSDLSTIRDLAAIRG